jgi:ABC-type Zn uptake system ZnuABC Zn-binding protein ZnuA
MSRLALSLTALFVALPLAACGVNADGTGSESEPQVKVITTLAVFEDFVRQIGGERVEVSALLPFGADPHTYEPTPQDVRRVTESHLAFANGLELEPGILNVIEPNLPNDASLIELAEEAAEAGAALRETDPHLWLSVDNTREYARIIRDALTEADPAGAEKYDQNYLSYLTRLDELDEYVQEKLSPLPPERRKLVTTHDAFGYLADYMDFEVAAVVSVSPGQEPSAADIAGLVQTIEEVGVAAVFEEPQLGAEATVLKQAAADAGIKVCTLYSDALDDRAPTYIDLMRFNADELARCLGV